MADEERMTLKALRARMGMTQNEAGKAIGVDRSTLARWEKDASEIPFNITDTISRVYKYPKDQIFFGNSIALSDKLKNL
ncbi:helix-turn-helix transcriptional regulator [Furfurilactobacillus entadae]|uniref:helix-turn-helix transcriptional regulator n=1 Tax=Furfurilactobacillus entadae TaxID=2922307 RepID=UPI0035E4C31A